MVMTIEDFEEDGNEAEKALIAACREGRSCILGPLPPEGAKTPTIRATLIRALALEATSLHEKGIWLQGAVITGVLDLHFAKCRGRLALDNCRFEEKLRLRQTELAQLSLRGSHLPGLFAQGAQVTGDVFLNDVTATGMVDVAGAHIGGQLECTGATLNGAGGAALDAQGAQVNGGVFLRGVTATGTVHVAGAQIGGQLECVSATLNGGGGAALDAQGAQVTQSVFLRGVTATGTVDVNGALIGGQLDCTGATLNGGGGMALNGQSLRVEQGFLFRQVKAVTGWVNLTSAHVGDLVDDAASWAKYGTLTLDGFTYDRISGGPAPKSFAARKDWLDKGAWFENEFFPQPYTQFARVMRAAGHDAEARKALMGGKEAAALRFRQQARSMRRYLRAMRQLSAKRSSERAEAVMVEVKEVKGAQAMAFTTILQRFEMIHLPWPTPPGAPASPPPYTMEMARRHFRNEMFGGVMKARLAIGWNWVLDFSLRHVVGYGYAPARSVRALLMLFLASWFVAYAAWEEGSFAPNSDVILVSQGWQDMLARDCFAADPVTGKPIAAPPDCLPNPAETWANDPAHGMDWDSFNSAGYAADLVIPILDLGQESAWAPSKDRGWWGYHLWWGRWLFSALGWIVTALGAAAVTGIIQRNDPK